MIIHVLVRRDTSRDPRDSGAYNDTVIGHCEDEVALSAVAKLLTERAVRSAEQYRTAWERETSAYWNALPIHADRSTANPAFGALGERLGAEAREAAAEDTAAIQMVDAAYRPLQDVTYHVVDRDVGRPIVISGFAADTEMVP